jgi:STE24 endopeptidase
VTVPASSGPADAGTPPDEVRLKAKRYQTLRLRLLLVRMVLSLLFPLLLLAGPSQALAAFLYALTQNRFLAVAVFFALFTLAYTLSLLPLNFYQGHVVEKRFGLSTETTASFFVDSIKGTAVSLVIGLPIVLAVYWSLNAMPEWWWLATGVVVAGFGVVLAKIAPVVIYPLFFKFEPLEDGELSGRMAALAERSGTSFSGIYRMELSAKSTEAEALLAGTGRTRRIVLSDTLLSAYDADEIEVILAHELGHHAMRHMVAMIAAQSVAVLAGLYLLSIVLRIGASPLGLHGIDDVAGLPLLVAAASFMQMVVAPIGNWWSRRLEAQADEYALKLTSKPAAFARAMRRLADQNLLDLEPSRLVEIALYAHPPVGRRIAAAGRFARAHGLEEAEPAEI